MALTIFKKTNSVVFCWRPFCSLSLKYKKHLHTAKATHYRNYVSTNTKKRNKEKIAEDESILALKNKYNQSVWTNAKENNHLYIADKNAAREMANFICEDSKDVIILEANPGPGVLTESLLEAGIPKLGVFEKDEAFLHTLKALSDRFPGHLRIINNDIMNGNQSLVKDNYTEINRDTLSIDEVPTLSWIDGIPGKFVGIISSPSSITFMRYIFVKLSTMGSFFAYGRFQFFLLLSQQEFEHLMAKPKENFNQYVEATIFYNVFFDVKYLKKFPIMSFLPLPKKSSTKKAGNRAPLHLVRLTPKRDLLTSVAGQDQLPHLYFFIRHHLKRRKNYVISSLEQWIPSCGPRLIKNGMQMFTRFGDLSPLQILNLFSQFSSFPEYKNSNFQEAVKNFFGRQGLPEM